MRQRMMIIVSAFALSACATHQPGWTGSGAQPFDSALAECQGEVAVIAVEAQREVALQQCMAQKGWTRP